MRKKRLELFKSLHDFLSVKHRSKTGLGLSRGLVPELCESLALGGLAVLPDWLWGFLMPHFPLCTVQYFLLTRCLQQNVQETMVNGD